MKILALRPEEELLLHCARLRPDPGTKARIRSLLEAEVDWDYLTAVAAYHKIQPLLFWYIKDIRPDSVPAETLSGLEEAFHGSSWLFLHLSRELIAIIDMLTAHNIRVIPLKGVILGQDLYPNPALRQAGDIDILVSAEDVLRAQAILVGHGFKAAPLTPGTEQAFLRTNHFRLNRPQTRTAVELHWRILPKHYRLAADFDELWQRHQPLVLLGRVVPNLAPEDQIPYLCMHLVKHTWPSLRWLGDIDALVTRYQTVLDWDWLVSRPLLGGSRRMFWLGLYATHLLVGTPLPARAKACLAADPALKPLAARFCRWLFQKENLPSEEKLKHHLFQLQVHDGGWERIHYLRYLVSPHYVSSDRHTLPLWLQSFFYLIKPVWLLLEMGFGRLSNNGGWHNRA
jgi:hypothetical protein